MSAAKMRKIRLIVSRDCIANMLSELMLLGCVEVSEPDELLMDQELAALVAREGSELESCRADYESLERALDIIGSYVTDDVDIDMTRQEITLDRLLYETYPESSLMLAKSIETLDSMLLILPEQDKPDIISQIKAANEHREDLQLCCDHFSIRIALAETIGKMLGTECTLILTGWTPAKSEPNLIQRFSQYICAWEFSDPTPGEAENVPVLQKGAKLLGRFQNETRKQFRPLVVRTSYVDVIRG